MQPVQLRLIAQQDNGTLAHIIRSTLLSFDAAVPGTAFYDPELDTLSETFQAPGSRYWVAEQNNTVIGGAGIYPSPGLPAAYCELVKLYLLPEARGKGIGKMLIAACLQSAGQLGYTHVYLETMPQLHMSLPLYEKMGFTRLEQPMGNTQHFGCNIWMLKSLLH
ncbi:GNAT family N-acetyltransferase [uncultured Chitinophaga sp.]|jgi:N-acetylglutamate synthase and related acetyltransferases|uniref:GNAT family N-acetyltransferase n=1 Tax=uncultured Chitinophaga sp. TaxID=339340 RepID=UPI00260D0FBD|nr:GNAT family N-acetyltransferase [uncultured Chitinophaga sp.]